MNTRLKIICKAIEIRMNNGEDFELILSSYPALTSEDIQVIREYFDIHQDLI